MHIPGAYENLMARKCHLCRNEFTGEFNRNISKSDFKPNWKLINEIKGQKIVIIDDEEEKLNDANVNVFTDGNEHEYYLFLEKNHKVNKYYKNILNENDINIIQNEFNIFCKFMINLTRCYDNNSEKKQSTKIK